MLILFLIIVALFFSWVIDFIMGIAMTVAILFGLFLVLRWMYRRYMGGE